MAKLIDKFFNRVIEGDLLEITQEEKERLGLSGTKLYKHFLSMDGAYNLVLINQEKDKIDFIQIDTYVKFKNYLDDKGFIVFYDADYLDVLKWSPDDLCFYSYYIEDGNVAIAYLDDWTFSRTTDTVTPL